MFVISIVRLFFPIWAKAQYNQRFYNYHDFKVVATEINDDEALAKFDKKSTEPLSFKRYKKIIFEADKENVFRCIS